MAYFDVRPSDHVPTVELRVCDACPHGRGRPCSSPGSSGPLVAEAIAADERRRARSPAGRRPVQRAAMWRAARSGLAVTCSAPDAGPHRAGRPRWSTALVDRLRPTSRSTGDWETVQRAGRGAAGPRRFGRPAAGPLRRARQDDRRRRSWWSTDARGHNRTPGRRRDAHRWTTRQHPMTRRSRCRASRPAYRRCSRSSTSSAPAELASGRTEHRASDVGRRRAHLRGRRRAAAVPGRSRAPHHPCARMGDALAAGLTQRARAIEAFLRDVYGPARIVADGVLDARRSVTTRRAGARRPRRCRRVSSGRRSSASTSSATPSAAGGCSRTTSGCRRASATRSACASSCARRCPNSPTARHARPATAHRTARPHAAGVRPARAGRPGGRAAVRRRGQLGLVRAPDSGRGRRAAAGRARATSTVTRGRRVRRRQARRRALPALDVELVDLVDDDRARVGAGILEAARTATVVAGERAGQRGGRRQGDVRLRPRHHRVLPGRAAAARARCPPTAAPIPPSSSRCSTGWTSW